MITDNKLYLADREEVTATGMAPKCLDLRVRTALGEKPFFAVLVSHGQASHSVQLSIVTSDDSTMATYTTLLTSGVIASEGLTRGAVYAVPLPVLPMGLMQRYLGVRFILDGTDDGGGSMDDLCTVLDEPALESELTEIPYIIPAGKTMPDQEDTYSVVITDALPEYKPWEFLDVALAWDPSTAPQLEPSGVVIVETSSSDTTEDTSTSTGSGSGTASP